MNLYAQIAHKLGLYSLKSELEDIALKYLEPKDYEHIVTKLEESAEERRAFIARFLVPIEERLGKLGIKYHIKSRTKSIFSIWTKMHKQNVPFEGGLRHLRHPHHHRLRQGAGETAVLDGLFHRHGFLHAQPQPHARLDLDPEIQRVRIAAHHRVGRRPVGRGADPHRTHGRRSRTRHRGALALQGGQPGSPDQRNVAGTPARTVRGHHAFAGAALRRQAGLGRDLRLHAQRRPAETARRGFAPGLRVRHPHLAGFHVRRGARSTTGRSRSANSSTTATSSKS